MSHKEGEGRRECQGAFLHAVFAFIGKDFQDLSSHPDSWKREKLKKKKIQKYFLLQTLWKCLWPNQPLDSCVVSVWTD